MLPLHPHTQAFATIVKEHIAPLQNAITTQTKVISNEALFTSKTIEKLKKTIYFLSRDLLQN